MPLAYDVHYIKANIMEEGEKNMKTSRINITVGIYDAEYVIRDYGHKIIVTVGEATAETWTATRSW